MKNILLTLMTILILSACAPATADPILPIETPAPQTEEPLYLPRPEDSKLTRGGVMLESTNLLTLESFPLQFTLELNGSLPTPCHLLRVAVNEPDSENKILLDVYSLTNPDLICTQIVKPFEVNIPLGSFPTGHYTLWVNGNQVAEFDS
ncbi:MAG: hypothetical protein HOP27_07125 [Anaerolineales bacterium]|nr:hypothetical protein [Anaerolineales bacterium]